MPKILSYTPPWLSRPSPGFNLFSTNSGWISSATYRGPRRIIARRGTEIFVVVDNQIRWSDLCMLKDEWDEQQKEGKAEVNEESNGFNQAGDDLEERSYRVGNFFVQKFR